MDTKHYDLIVFGGGNAISTAIQCGAKGLQVALVEKGPLGDTCPHRGCIPSKLLIGYADAAENARDARRFGFETTVRTTDPDAILRNTFDFTKKYDSILEKALGKNVTLYRNRAVFTSNRTLRINDTSISADKLVLATGSRPQHVALDVPIGPATKSSSSTKCRSRSRLSAAAISRVSLGISSTESTWTR